MTASLPRRWSSKGGDFVLEPVADFNRQYLYRIGGFRALNDCHYFATLNMLTITRTINNIICMDY